MTRGIGGIVAIDGCFVHRSPRACRHLILFQVLLDLYRSRKFLLRKAIVEREDDLIVRISE